MTSANQRSAFGLPVLAVKACWMSAHDSRWYDQERRVHARDAEGGVSQMRESRRVASHRVIWLVCGLLSFSAPAQAQEDPAAWAGTWAAVHNDIELRFGVTLSVENGQVTGGVLPWEVMRGADPISSASLAGRRLTLEVEPYDEDEPPGHVVLELAADAASIRVVEGRIEGQRIGRYTLTRRDALWSRTRVELYDLGQENDAQTLQYFARLATAVSAGLTAASSRALSDPPQVGCALEVVVDCYRDNLSVARARAVAIALARAAGSATICNRALDELVVEGVGGPTEGCGRIVVEDDDGETTLRARPSSRAESAGTARNGQAFTIGEVRGRWLRVGFMPPRWLWAENARCLR